MIFDLRGPFMPRGPGKVVPVYPPPTARPWTIYINQLLATILKEFESKELKALSAKAYPAPKKASKVLAAERPIDISRVDIRVGKILSVEPHPDADSLYIEKIDLGEEILEL